MTYNEYWQIIDAGLSPDDLITFKYEDEGVATDVELSRTIQDRLELLFEVEENDY